VISVSSPATKEDLAQYEAWRQRHGIEETTGFEGDNLVEEVWARDILQNAGLPVDPKEKVSGKNGSVIQLWEFVQDGAYKTIEWYAVEILQKIALVRLVIANGNSPAIANFACELGALYNEAQNKFRFENWILERSRHKKGRQNWIREQNASRGQQARQNWKPAQQRYLELRFEGAIKSAAREIVRDEIIEGSIPCPPTIKSKDGPSDTTLKKWLP
jgi:hypothetical protein|tara:strand:- start:266 stop:913 length:648 start_codon:yes stop_codon:yes gene_type:complete